MSDRDETNLESSKIDWAKPIELNTGEPLEYVGPLCSWGGPPVLRCFKRIGSEGVYGATHNGVINNGPPKVFVRNSEIN